MVVLDNSHLGLDSEKIIVKIKPSDVIKGLIE